MEIAEECEKLDLTQATDGDNATAHKHRNFSNPNGLLPNYGEDGKLR